MPGEESGRRDSAGLGSRGRALNCALVPGRRNG
jgi:hypothetical protein